MKLVYRLAHMLLVLVLTASLVRTVYYGLSLLWKEQNPQPPPQDVDNEPARKPSSQEIAASMNTLWDMWDVDHCKNICEASWIACRLRHCDDVPGVRRPDEL